MGGAAWPIHRRSTCPDRSAGAKKRSGGPAAKTRTPSPRAVRLHAASRTGTCKPPPTPLDFIPTPPKSESAYGKARSRRRREPPMFAGHASGARRLSHRSHRCKTPCRTHARARALHAEWRRGAPGQPRARAGAVRYAPASSPPISLRLPPPIADNRTCICLFLVPECRRLFFFFSSLSLVFVSYNMRYSLFRLCSGGNVMKKTK